MIISECIYERATRDIYSKYLYNNLVILEFIYEHSLGFSVVLFCSTAMIALLVMMLRRSKLIGGELGGPRGYKIATSCLFVFLWLFYVLMSSLEAYGYINGKYTSLKEIKT